MSGKTGTYNLRHRISGAFQTVDKPLCFLKMGSQGRSPRQGLGAVAPVKSPFPGERGQFGKDAEIRTHQALQDAKPSECPKGDRDSKLEVCFKNRLFLQT